MSDGATMRSCQQGPWPTKMASLWSMARWTLANMQWGLHVTLIPQNIQDFTASSWQFLKAIWDKMEKGCMHQRDLKQNGRQDLTLVAGGNLTNQIPLIMPYTKTVLCQLTKGGETEFVTLCSWSPCFPLQSHLQGLVTREPISIPTKASDFSISLFAI